MTILKNAERGTSSPATNERKLSHVAARTNTSKGPQPKLNGHTDKPQTYSALDRLPPALAPLVNLKRWVVWRWEWIPPDPEKKTSGRWTKEPYQAAQAQYHAKSNDSRTWGDYSTALAAYRDRRNDIDGIGFMLLKGDVAALDLDKCRDADTEKLSDWVQKYVDKAQELGAYVEATVSGTGLRIIGLGKDGKAHRKFFNKDEIGSSVEVYRKAERYITISGLELGTCSELPNIDALIDETITSYEQWKNDAANQKGNASEDKLSDAQYQELLEHGTIDGEVVEHPGAQCHRLVWHLAAQGESQESIVTLLRQHPNGVAAKFLKPTDRLEQEVKRSFDKFTANLPWPIGEWNARHAHVLAGSKSCILQEFETPEGFIDFKLLSSASFEEWNAEHVMQIQVGDEIEVIPQTKFWLKHRQRRKYQDIGFFPNRDVPEFYNLWRGLAVEPRQGDCSKFPAHIHDNICQGDDELYAWVMAWFADIFQRPSVKCGTSLAFRGKQGVGKTKVGEVFESLLGVHYKQVSDPRYVTGRFNSHMISLLLLFADEGFWAGDKKAEGKLKDLITGKKHPIEYKGKEAFWIDNYVRLLVSGNEDWVVPAAFEERRFATLDVGDEYREDYPYFAAIDKEMNSGGREALLYHLLFEVDCSQVNLRQIPHTEALVDQKIQSANPEQAWWLDILRNGVLPGDWEGTGLAPSELLFDHYVEHAKKKGVPRRAIETQLGLFLSKMLGDENLTRSKKTWLMPEPVNTNNMREQRRSLVYQFPSLAFCRQRFTEVFNEQMDWDAETDWTADGNIDEADESAERVLLRDLFRGEKCLPEKHILAAGKKQNLTPDALRKAAIELGFCFITERKGKKEACSWHCNERFARARRY